MFELEVIIRVLITGGSGFLGSHIVRSVVDAGHEPRLIVRDIAKAGRVLSNLALPESAFIVGDVLDTVTVRDATHEMDALIHCANVFSLRSQNRDLLVMVNETGTDQVLTLAHAAGLDPMIFLSSYVALLPSDDVIGPDSPVGEPKPIYADSKARAERVARNHQADGEPVVTVYPGVVWGPGDPTIGESTSLMVHAVRGKFRLANSGYLPITDVRDVASVVTKCLEPGRGPRRYMATGGDYEFRSLLKRIGRHAAKNLWSIRVPSVLAIATGKSADALRGTRGFDPALAYEPIWINANGQQTDSSATKSDLNIGFTNIDTTISDTMAWLTAENLI